jgi:hypothetical protein
MAATSPTRNAALALPLSSRPGGRWGGYVQNVIATKLAANYRVITWDRRNTDGRSDIIISGDPEGLIVRLCHQRQGDQ